jgi:hypothetical protein
MEGKQDLARDCSASLGLFFDYGRETPSQRRRPVVAGGSSSAEKEDLSTENRPDKSVQRYDL